MLSAVHADSSMCGCKTHTLTDRVPPLDCVVLLFQLLGSSLQDVVRHLWLVTAARLQLWNQPCIAAALPVAAKPLTHVACLTTQACGYRLGELEDIPQPLAVLAYTQIFSDIVGVRRALDRLLCLLRCRTCTFTVHTAHVGFLSILARCGWPNMPWQWCQVHVFDWPLEIGRTLCRLLQEALAPLQCPHV